MAADWLTEPTLVESPTEAGSSAMARHAHGEACLIGLFGGTAGRRFPLGQELLLGRHPHCTVQVEASDVSREHARIVRRESGSYVLQDLNSRNGTHVNGQAVSLHELRFGDTVQLGFNTVFLLSPPLHTTEDQELPNEPLEAAAQLAAGVAHHFNNLFAVALTNLSYILQFPATTPLSHDDVQESLSDTQKALFQATKLTQQLLGFARLGKYQDARVNISDLIRVIAARTQAKAPRVHLDLSAVDSNLWVQGDPAQLEQALSNLCDNALEALGCKGLLTLAANFAPEEAAPTGEPRKTKPALISRAKVIIRVSDTGVGMDPETREHAFEPFFSTKGPTSGGGLGLAAVYGIIKQHDGTISMESSPGFGTTFTIELSSATPEPIETERPIRLTQ